MTTWTAPSVAPSPAATVPTTVERLVALVVPALADWCLVQRRAGDRLVPVAAAHRDPDRAEEISRLLPESVPDGIVPDHPEVLERGESVLVREIAPRSVAADARQEISRELPGRFRPTSYLMLPLSIGKGEVWGAITFARGEAAPPFGAEELRSAESFAALAGEALAAELARADAEREIAYREQAEQRLRMQLEVARILADAVSSEAAAAPALASIARGFGWEGAVLWTVEPEGERLFPAAVCGAPAHEPFFDEVRGTTLSPGEGLPGRVRQRNEPAFCDDLTADGTIPHREAALAVGLRRAVAFPAALGDEVFGTLELWGSEARAIDGALVSNAASVSLLLGQFLARVRSDAQLRRRAHELERIYALTDQLTRAATPAEMHEEAIDALLSTTSATRASILLFAPDGVLRFVASRGLSAEYRAAVEGHTPWSPDRIDAVPILVADALASEELAPYRPTILAEGVRALAFIPLRGRNRLLGKFMLYVDRPHHFRPDEIRLAETIARHVAFAIERRKEESSALERLTLLQGIADGTADAVYVKDRTGRYLMVNATAERIFGLPAKEILGRTDRDFLPPEAAESLIRSDLRTLAAGSPTTVLERVPTPGGERIFQSSKGVYRTAHGEPAGVFGISRDVTLETRLAERERYLSEASAVLAGGLDSEAALSRIATFGVPLLGDAMLVHLRNGDGRLRLVEAVFPNAGWRSRWDDYERRFPGDAIPRSRAGPERVVATGRSVVHQLDGPELAALPIPEDRRRALGELGIRSEAIVPLGSGGHVLGALSVLTLEPQRRLSAADLPYLEELGRRAGAAVQNSRLYAESQTEVARRRAAEAEKDRLVRELAAAKDRIDSLMRSVPGVVWEAWGSPDASLQRIDFVSAHVEKMLGYTVAEWLAAPNFWLSIVHPEDRATAAEVAGRAYREGLDRHVNEFRWVAKDGRIVHCHAQSVLIRDEAGQPVGMRGVTLDISQRKEAEEALARKAEELARSNAELEQFAYVASHDLQEPLRNVASYTQLLARRYRGSLDEQADRYIAYAVEGAVRMQALIQDLLAFSRAGRSQEPETTVPLGEALGAATENLAAALRDQDGRIEIDGELPVVRGSLLQLTQLFQNLVGNAVKFRSEAPPVVRISARRSGREWEISVGDNGIGFDAGHADRVFVIFQRLHARERYPGSGIGLAICKRIVEMHGGKIWASSTEGAGATFRFTLPV